MNHDKFQRCLEAAKRIVALYRSEAPDGCDPQNTYVALATAVVGAGTAAYGAYQQNKASKAASAAAGAGAGIGKFKPLNLPQMPAYQPNNLGQLNKEAIKFDSLGYARSDADFSRRHQPIVDAEKLFEQQVLKDQQGENELMPQMQNEFMRAGLAGSLGAFGDSVGTLAPGSAGEADVARNLGISIMGFQDRNRENRTKSLMVAEELFPRRQFGLTGQDAAGVMMANNAGVNNWNQADYANKVQLAQYDATGQANFNNAGIAQQNILGEASARSEAAKMQAIITAAEMAAKLGTTYAANRNTTASRTPAATTAATGSVGAGGGSGWKYAATG